MAKRYLVLFLKPQPDQKIKDSKHKYAEVPEEYSYKRKAAVDWMIDKFGLEPDTILVKVVNIFDVEEEEEADSGWRRILQPPPPEV